MSSFFHQYGDVLQSAAEKWESTLKQSKEQFTVLIDRALEIFSEGNVYELNIVANNLTGLVVDGDRFNVTVNLNFLGLSSCSCNNHYFCEHQLAVFFTAYDKIDKLDDLVSNWRQSDPSDLERIKKQFNLQTARDLTKESLQREMKLANWLEDFERNFNTTLLTVLRGGNRHNLERACQLYFIRNNLNTPKRIVWKSLHGIAQVIYGVQRLVRLLDEDDFIKEPCITCLNFLTENIDEHLLQVRRHNQTGHYNSFVNLLRQEFIEVINFQDDLFANLAHLEIFNFTEQISVFYNSLWKNLFQKSSWRQEERKRLEQLFVNGAHDDQIILYGGCYSYLLFLNKADDEVIKVWRQIGPRAVLFALMIVEELIAVRALSRANVVIAFIVENSRLFINTIFLDMLRREYSDRILRIVEKYGHEAGQMTQFERLILQLLPYSIDEGISQFFHKGDYDKWVELLILKQTNVNDISSFYVDEVRDKAPATLVPLYHLSIERFINLKTRPNYRQAAVLLVELRNIYTDLDKLNRWEIYWRKLQQSTNRLRAFHDECERAGL